MGQYILILLGLDEEYLGYKIFPNEDSLDKFVESIEDLIMANIEGKLPLKQRLSLAPEYFLYAGGVVSFDIIDTDEELSDT